MVDVLLLLIQLAPGLLQLAPVLSQLGFPFFEAVAEPLQRRAALLELFVLPIVFLLPGLELADALLEVAEQAGDFVRILMTRGALGLRSGWMVGTHAFTTLVIEPSMD